MRGMGRPVVTEAGGGPPFPQETLQSLAATRTLSTGLAGLEPTTYGLGNRQQPMRRNRSQPDLPSHLPKPGKADPT